MGIAVGCALLLIAAIVGLGLFIKYSKQPETDPPTADIELKEEKPKCTEIELGVRGNIYLKNVKFSDKLGHGNFGKFFILTRHVLNLTVGDVFKGTWNKSVQVAIKRVNATDREEVLKEAALVMYVKVTEYVLMSSLKEFVSPKYCNLLWTVSVRRDRGKLHCHGVLQ